MKIALGTLAFLFCLSAQATNQWIGHWEGEAKWTNNYGDLGDISIDIELFSVADSIFVTSFYWENEEYKTSGKNILLDGKKIGYFTDKEVFIDYRMDMDVGEDEEVDCQYEFQAKKSGNFLYYSDLIFCVNGVFERLEGYIK